MGVARRGRSLLVIAALALASVACGGGDDETAEPSPSASGSPRASERARATARQTPRASGVSPAPGATPFDAREWRQETIERFGPERTFADGSKENYVDQAEALCATEDRPDYEEGSIQRWMEETYCPHAGS